MADTVSTTVMPPSDWPKVTLGGRTYTVRYGMLANYELSRAGVSPASVLNLLRVADDPHNFAHILDLWRACTAHEFKLAAVPQDIPTVEQWISVIEALPEPVPVEAADGKPVTRSWIGNFIAPAVRDAILKWSADRAAAAVPAQSVAATPTPSPTPIQ